MSLFGYLIWYIWVGNAKIVLSISPICFVAESEYDWEVSEEEYCPPTWLNTFKSVKDKTPFSDCIILFISEILTFCPNCLIAGLK